MLTGIIAPDDGVIRFEGRDIGSIAAHRRARLGIVRAFQIPRPFAQLSVYENVLTAALTALAYPARARNGLRPTC